MNYVKTKYERKVTNILMIDRILGMLTKRFENVRDFFDHFFKFFFRKKRTVGMERKYKIKSLNWGNLIF